MQAFCIRPLPYKILDSNALKAKKYKALKQYPNIATYQAFNQVNVAYCLQDKNRWIDIETEKIEFVMEHRFEKLDTTALPQLILFWQVFNYNKTGGTSTDWMSVIRLDSIPMQIFKICLGCNEEYFGNKEKNGEGAFYNSYVRSVKLNKNMIVIADNNKKQYPYPECPISNVPKGKYKMMFGQIIKVK